MTPSPVWPRPPREDQATCHRAEGGSDLAAMANREKRKTSLGNTLEVETSDEHRETQGRGRSVSESSELRQRPKLFRSVREAMEFEAAEEATLHQLDRGRTRGALDARTLSCLEKTQADRAGYTVIRRRASSDSGNIDDASPTLGRPGQPTSGRAQRGRQTRGRRGGSGHRPTAKSIQVSHQKRLARSSPEPSASHLPKADDHLDEQRWLAAASAGEVLPGGISQHSPSRSPAAETSWDVSGATWKAPLPISTNEPPAAESAPSQLKEPSSGGDHGDAEALPESMLSWLERALSLDETRAPFPPTPPSSEP